MHCVLVYYGMPPNRLSLTGGLVQACPPGRYGLIAGGASALQDCVLCPPNAYSGLPAAVAVPNPCSPCAPLEGSNEGEQDVPHNVVLFGDLMCVSGEGGGGMLSVAPGIVCLSWRRMRPLLH